MNKSHCAFPSDECTGFKYPDIDYLFYCHKVLIFVVYNVGDSACIYFIPK